MMWILRKELLLYTVLCAMTVVRYYVKAWKRKAVVECTLLQGQLHTATQEYRALMEEYDKLIQPSRLKRLLKEIAKHHSKKHKS